MVKRGVSAPQTSLLRLWPWVRDKVLSLPAAAVMAGRQSSSLGDWAPLFCTILMDCSFLMLLKVNYLEFYAYNLINIYNKHTEGDSWDRYSSCVFLFWVQVVLHPTPNSPKQSELHKMTVTKACPDQDLKIKLAIRMDKPQNMKHCGWDTQSCFPSIFHPLAYRNPALSALVASFLVLYVEKYCQVYCAPWWMYICVRAYTHICTRRVMYQNNYT